MDYKTIGKAMQIEGNHAVLDKDFLEVQGIKVEGDLNRSETVALFNKVAVQNNLFPVKDPMGYLKLDNNLHDAILEIYKDKYEESIKKIDAGYIAGGKKSMEGVLNKLPAITRRDMKDYLPEGATQGDLNYIKATPEMKKAVGEYAESRTQLTYLKNIRRSVDDSTFEKLDAKLDEIGSVIKDRIAVASGMQVEKKSLSINKLLENANGNVAGLNAFKAQLENPDEITKPEGEEHAVASFTTKNVPDARFLLANKEYLAPFGFEIQKGRGEVTTKWSSLSVDVMYEERNAEIDIDLSGLESDDLSL